MHKLVSSAVFYEITELRGTYSLFKVYVLKNIISIVRGEVKERI